MRGNERRFGAGGVSPLNRDTPRPGVCLSAPVRPHYRAPMSDLAPAASPNVLTGRTSARRGESRLRVVARTAFPFLVVALAWEVTAHLGIFPRKLFPPLEEVAAALIRLTADGVLPHHVLDTLVRLLAGFALAAVAGVAIGFAMGRSRRAEDVFLPLVSIGAPIPGLAYAPLFLLW